MVLYCTVHSTAVCNMLAVHVFAIGLHCLDCVLPPRSFMRNNPFSRGHCSVSMEKFFVCSTAALTDPGLGMAATNKLGTAMTFLYCCFGRMRTGTRPGPTARQIHAQSSQVAVCGRCQNNQSCCIVGLPANISATSTAHMFSQRQADHSPAMWARSNL